MFFDLSTQASKNMLREQQAATELIYQLELLNLRHRLFHVLFFNTLNPIQSIVGQQWQQGAKSKVLDQDGGRLVHEAWPCKHEERSYAVGCGTT